MACQTISSHGTKIADAKDATQVPQKSAEHLSAQARNALHYPPSRSVLPQSLFSRYARFFLPRVSSSLTHMPVHTYHEAKPLSFMRPAGGFASHTLTRGVCLLTCLCLTRALCATGCVCARAPLFPPAGQDRVTRPANACHFLRLSNRNPHSPSSVACGATLRNLLRLVTTLANPPLTAPLCRLETI